MRTTALILSIVAGLGVALPLSSGSAADRTMVRSNDQSAWALSQGQRGLMNRHEQIREDTFTHD